MTQEEVQSHVKPVLKQACRQCVGPKISCPVCEIGKPLEYLGNLLCWSQIVTMGLCVHRRQSFKPCHWSSVVLEKVDHASASIMNIASS